MTNCGNNPIRRTPMGGTISQACEYPGFLPSAGLAMKTSVIAIMVLTGYLGFEAFVIKRAGERTTPDYIYRMLVRSELATEFCGKVDPSLAKQFEHTVARVVDRYKRELTAGSDNPDTETIELTINSTARQARNEIEPLLKQQNCDTQTLKNEFRRYRIYAKKS